MSYDKNMWNSVRNELQKDKTRKEEIDKREIKCQNNQTLRFYEKVVGKPGSSGYCLFICLHGGGQGSASMNDGQWKQIIPFEQNGFKQGTIGVAARGITNTWNLHFVNESFPAITRLVEDYIIFKNVDPNKVYLMGFSAGGDGTYALSERLPFLFAACSPQAGHPNGISTINLCNLPTYLAAGEKDTSFKRNEICVDYYRQIIGHNGKYCGKYIAKVEVVHNSGHSFQCWKTPRYSYFNGDKNPSKTNDTAFTFMYSYVRNPNPSEISCDVKTFLTPLRNYYTHRGNSFYNIEVGKNPPNMIQLQINYGNNTINVKEGNNFKINLVSSLFKKGNVVNVTCGGKTQPYQLQKDNNYAKSNMKLFCDPNFGYDSYINIGDYQSEISVENLPKPAFAVSQMAQPAEKKAPQKAPQNPPQKPPQKPDSAKPKLVTTHAKLENVKQPVKNGHNPAQYIVPGKNGGPFLCVKLSETEFAWSNNTQYWVKQKKNGALLDRPIYVLKKVFYVDPKGHFFDVPKGNYFLLLRHNPTLNIGLNVCRIFVKVDDKEIFNNTNFFKKDYRRVRGKKLIDDFVVHINENSFSNSNNHEVFVQIIGENTVKRNWELDGFILLPDHCDGHIEKIYNQYFNNTLFK